LVECVTIESEQNVFVGLQFGLCGISRGYEVEIEVVVFRYFPIDILSPLGRFFCNDSDILSLDEGFDKFSFFFEKIGIYVVFFACREGEQ
jgi:hypothetical protein